MAKEAPDEKGEVRHSEEEHEEVEQLVQRLRKTDPEDSGFDTLGGARRGGRRGTGEGTSRKVITREHVQALLQSPAHDPTLIVVSGRVAIAAAAELNTDRYRGALEIVSREDLATQLGADVPSERDLEELAARLDAMVRSTTRPPTPRKSRVPDCCTTSPTPTGRGIRTSMRRKGPPTGSRPRRTPSASPPTNSFWRRSATRTGRTSEDPDPAGAPSTKSIHKSQWRQDYSASENAMIILGIVLLIIGFVTGVSALWTIGIILLAVGAVLWLLGSMGRAFGGRRHYW